MKSAGNDIVALNAIDIHRTRDTRFYSKFITDAELGFYQPLAVLPFESFVWLLWSVKESAYKFLKRHNGDLLFSPIKLIVQQINIPANLTLNPFTGIYWDSEVSQTNYVTGIVACGNIQLYFRSYITTDFITSAVNANEQFTDVYWGIQLVEFTDHQHQSTEVRNFALIKLKSVLKSRNLQIIKSEIGYPVVIGKETKPLDVALSFAHHDHFAGYSFIL